MRDGNVTVWVCVLWCVCEVCVTITAQQGQLTVHRVGMSAFVATMYFLTSSLACCKRGETGVEESEGG